MPACLAMSSIDLLPASLASSTGADDENADHSQAFNENTALRPYSSEFARLMREEAFRAELLRSIPLSVNTFTLSPRSKDTIRPNYCHFVVKLRENPRWNNSISLLSVQSALSAVLALSDYDFFLFQTSLHTPNSPRIIPASTVLPLLTGTSRRSIAPSTNQSISYVRELDKSNFITLCAQFGTENQLSAQYSHLSQTKTPFLNNILLSARASRGSSGSSYVYSAQKSLNARKFDPDNVLGVTFSPQFGPFPAHFSGFYKGKAGKGQNLAVLGQFSGQKQANFICRAQKTVNNYYGIDKIYISTQFYHDNWPKVSRSSVDCSVEVGIGGKINASNEINVGFGITNGEFPYFSLNYINNFTNLSLPIYFPTEHYSHFTISRRKNVISAISLALFAVFGFVLLWKPLYKRGKLRFWAEKQRNSAEIGRKLAQRAEIYVEAMRGPAEAKLKHEIAAEGLIICRALYGQSHNLPDLCQKPQFCSEIDVTIPCRYFVRREKSVENGQLSGSTAQLRFPNRSKAKLMGFYRVLRGEKCRNQGTHLAILYVEYIYAGRGYWAAIGDEEAAVLPNQGHEQMQLQVPR
jgi:hypothetical protein